MDFLEQKINPHFIILIGLNIVMVLILF